MNFVQDVTNAFGVTSVFDLYKNINQIKLDNAAARLQNQIAEYQAQVPVLSLQRDIAIAQNQGASTNASGGFFSGMSANTKMLLTVGVLGVAAWFVLKKA